jgi:apolipoprotein N-acyltransferase
MKIRKFFTHYQEEALALLAGATLTLAFAPFYFFPLAVLSPALLLWLWLTVTPQQAFWRGWLYGLGFFGTGVSWVYISIHTFGNASVFLAALITMGFIALLALFPALQGYLLNRFFPENNGRKMICTFAAIWVLLEWLRSLLFTGFPWLLLGDSQLHSPLKGYAPIYGVYGVSLAVLLSSGILVHIIWNIRKKKFKSVYYSFAALALLWSIGGGLTFIKWTKPLGNPIQVSLIQGNIPQELKWEPDQLQHTLDRYAALTQAHWDSKIIIWPEDAVPLPLQSATRFISQLDTAAKQHHVTIMMGIPVKSQFADDTYYNAVIAIGANTDAYLKHLLVPFGEYTPRPTFFKPIMKLFDIPMSDLLSSKDKIKPLQIDGIKIATFICYEIAYPEFVVSHTSSSGMLLTVSNDAWFGHSIASAQHLAIAQMRALEMGRPLLFVSNTGITAIIKPNGTLQAVAPKDTAYVLTEIVQPMAGETYWQKRPMDPLLILLILLLVNTFKYRWQQKKKKKLKEKNKQKTAR